jgi:hypothetical protein
MSNVVAEPYLIPDPYGVVYVPQVPLTSNGGQDTVRPRVDLRPAEKYGKLCYLIDWCNLDEADPAALLHELRTGLKDYNDNDYLLMVGNPTLMALAALVASEQNDGRIRLLYWRREQRRYTIVNIDLDAPPPK